MQNSLTIVQNSPIPAWRIQEIGLYRAPSGQATPLHQHRCWELVYYRAGNVRTHIGEDLMTTHPGTLVVIPPGVPHDEIAGDQFANIYFQIELDGTPDWPKQCVDDDQRAIGTLLFALLQEWNSNHPRREEMLQALLTQLDIQLQRASTRQAVAPESQIVVAVEHLMELRFADPITIAELAYEVGVAASTLRQYFKQQRHTTPQMCLHAIRERHALALLRTTTLTIGEIARLCGYDSASHLSHHLRRRTGQSPGRLRHQAS